jgi:hypothetical protein
LGEVLDLHLRGDGDGVAERTVDRAMLGVEAVHALDGGASLGRGGEVIGDVDAADDQDVVFELDLTPDLGREATVAGVDVARLQRTSEGAGQSAAGGGYDIVESRGVGLDDLGIHLVVGGDGTVDAESHGTGFGGEIGESQRPGLALDSHLRNIDDVAHWTSER